MCLSRVTRPIKIPECKARIGYKIFIKYVVDNECRYQSVFVLNLLTYYTIKHARKARPYRICYTIINDKQKFYLSGFHVWVSKAVAISEAAIMMERYNNTSLVVCKIKYWGNVIRGKNRYLDLEERNCNVAEYMEILEEVT